MKLTEAEYNALAGAVDYYSSVVEESDWPGWKAKLAALESAWSKIKAAQR